MNSLHTLQSLRRRTCLFLTCYAHARYSSWMIDRFLNWGDHEKPKSGKIKGRCQPPLVRSPPFLPSPCFILSILYLVRVLNSVRGPRFIPRPYFIPSPWSAVRSPQSLFYTDRIAALFKVIKLRNSETVSWKQTYSSNMSHPVGHTRVQLNSIN